MSFTASRMLDTFILYYKNWSTQLREHFYQLENNFKKVVSTEIFLKETKTIHEKMRIQKEECQKTHTSKLSRDRTDAPGSYIDISPTETRSTSQPSTESTSNTNNALKKKRKKGKRKCKPIRKRKPAYKHHRQEIKSGPLKKSEISQDLLDKTVLNLSSREINNNHKFVFYLGPSFAITPKDPDRKKLLEDVNNWAISLRRGFIYSRLSKPDANANTNTANTLKQRIKQMEQNLKIKPLQKSNISNSGNHALELFINTVNKQIANHPGNHVNKPTPKNIDKETLDTISEMKGWDDTIIRLFDKGTGFVLLDKDDYIQRVEAPLQDTSTFKTIANPTQTITNTTSSITDWTINHKEELGMSTNFKEWVIPNDENLPGVNYMNIKAHKPEKNFPGRLISTGCNSYIQNLAIFTAQELKKVQLKHCLKGTNDLLQKIKLLNESGILKDKKIYHVTFDVEAMFPSISKDMGIDACRNHLNKRVGEQLFSTDCILDAIEITLDNNLTVFNKKMYTQVSGTAMGPNNACDYADVALDDLDHKIINSTEIKNPIFYARFRDDIYIPWIGTLEELHKFCAWLNKYHPNLRFTMSEPSLDGTMFLEIFIYSKNGHIHTMASSKPTDSHSYMLPHSCHPTHIAKNIPHGVAHKVYKNCSDPETYIKCKNDFTNYMQDRLYSKDLIGKAFQTAESLNRDSVITKESKINPSDGNQRCFPLVCDFNPSLPPVGKILHQNKFILDVDPTLTKIIKPENIFVSYRGNKTIKDILVHSRLHEDKKPFWKSSSLMSTQNNPNISKTAVDAPPPIDGDNGCYRCESGCKVCDLYIKETHTAQSFHSDFVVNIQGKLTCGTIGVIYLINDLLCRRSSIGSTENNTKVRWSNHKSHIKMNRRTCEISVHYNDSEFHNITKDPLNVFDLELSKQIEIIIIEKVDFGNRIDKDKTAFFKERELYWQNQLNTFESFGGLNKRDPRNEIKSA